MHAERGYTYPVCPGTAHGRFDEVQHRFVNFGFTEVAQDVATFLQKLRAVNPAIKVILTVSPVQLMASYMPGNVLVSSSYSKAVLRAVCGEIAGRFDFVEYFPSYEIVSSPVSGGIYVDADKRSVTEAGVEHVMTCFMASYVDVAVSAPATVDVRAEYDHARQAAERLLAQQCEEQYNDPSFKQA